MIKHATQFTDLFLTANQASQFLNISVSTLKKLISEGKVKTLKTPGGHHRIPKSSLLSLVDHGHYFGQGAFSPRGFKSAYQILEPMVSAFEVRSALPCGHSSLVAKTCGELAKALNFSPERLKKLQIAALLHDIGEEIVRLMKPLNGISAMVRQHHEHFDGSGYPDGLQGKDILLEARIIHLVEAYVSLTSGSPYKAALTTQEALKELEQKSGTQFDPELVTEFISQITKQDARA